MNRLARLQARIGQRFAANLSALAAAQLAMRVSRLVTTVVLTRLLSPVDFGTAAVVLTVYELVALFTRNGIAARVVQADDAELGQVAQTAYWLTWIACGVLMLLQAAIALPVAWMYHDTGLALPIALMGVIYLATPLCNIQCALMQREGRMGRIALAAGVQVVADNALTALFALLGMGMWAIVLPKILVAPIWVAITLTGHAWRPRWPQRFGTMLAGWRGILRFSRGVLAVEALTTLQANVDNLLVGYLLGMEALGVYYFAFNAGLGITLGLVNAFGTAVYPHLCEVRSSPVALAARYRDSLRTLGAAVVPLILLQVILAPIYVPLVFGEKWTGAVPVLMIICLSALPRPFAATCSQLLKAVGRPGVELRWQAWLTVLLVASVAIGTAAGVIGVALAVLAVHMVVLVAFCRQAPRPFIGPFAGGLAPLAR